MATSLKVVTSLSHAKFYLRLQWTEVRFLEWLTFHTTSSHLFKKMVSEVPWLFFFPTTHVNICRGEYPKTPRLVNKLNAYA